MARIERTGSTATEDVNRSGAFLPRIQASLAGRSTPKGAAMKLKDSVYGIWSQRRCA